MELLIEELRKIWRPSVVTVLVVLGALYYALFAQYWVTAFPYGDNNRADLALAEEWVERYGPTLEPAERAELDGQWAAETALFAAQVAQVEGAAAAGITDYESFRAFDDRLLAEYGAAAESGLSEAAKQRYEEGEELVWRIFDETDSWRLQQFSTFLERYDQRDDSPFSAHPEFAGLSAGEQERVREIEATASHGTGLLPFFVLEASVSYGQWLATWTVLSVILLLSPPPVTDRLCRIRPLQWSSRTGRAVGGVSLRASLLSAFVLTVANVALYGLPLLMQGPAAFLACPIDAVTGIGFAWLDCSYGAYLLILAGLVLGLGLASGAAAWFLARFSGTYVAMLLKAVPLFVALGVLFGPWILDAPFFFVGPGYPWRPPGIPGFEPAVLALVLAAALALAFAAVSRQCRQELLV